MTPEKAPDYTDWYIKFWRGGTNTRLCTIRLGRWGVVLRTSIDDGWLITVGKWFEHPLIIRGWKWAFQAYIDDY